MYEIRKDYRESPRAPGASMGASWLQVAEADVVYGAGPAAARPAIHAFVVESEGQYVVECLEVAVVTQGASLDEALGNLREALDLYLDGEDPAVLGLAPEPRLVITFETSARSP